MIFSLFFYNNLTFVDYFFFFFFQAEDGIRDTSVTGVQTCALPISPTSPTGGVVKKMFAEPGYVPVSTGAGPGADGPFAANGLVPRLVPRNRTAALFTRLSTPPPLPRVSWAGAVRIPEPGWTVTVAPPWKVTPAGFAPRVTAVGTLGWALTVSDPASASGVVAGMPAAS